MKTETSHCVGTYHFLMHCLYFVHICIMKEATIIDELKWQLLHSEDELSKSPYW